MNELRNESAALGALSELAPELAQMLVAVVSDIALVLDTEGVVLSVALSGAQPLSSSARDWVGHPWSDTVTSDARQKVEALLSDVAATGVSRERRVSHPSPFGPDIPYAYTAFRLGKRGPVLALGRDLDAVATIQQRLIQTQQEMEREYWQRRQAETRYRFLFQIAGDAVLVIDSATLCVVDANRAASRVLGLGLEELIGKNALAGFDRSSQQAIGDLLATVKFTRRAAAVEARLAHERGTLHLSATPLQSEGASLILMRMRALDAPRQLLNPGTKLIKLMERTPDAIVFTDSGGRVIGANPAFLELAQLSDHDLALGRALGDWIAGSGEGGLPAILDTARKNGSGRFLAMFMRDESGQGVAIEMSAAMVGAGDDECIGFIIHIAHGRTSEGYSATPREGQIQ